ncbi:MAG: peptide chain release factor 2 [bacterium]|nr:peptide chain release factor 2 [bacterium]
METIKEKLESLKAEVRKTADRLDVSGKEKRIRELEAETVRPDFWGRLNAQEIFKELNDLKNEVKFWRDLEKETSDLLELYELAETDAAIREEAEKKHEELLEKFKKEETKIFLGGQYDKDGAIISIHAGAGGRDAADWAAMLLRMYQKYSEKRGWPAKILHQHLDEEGGIKNATLEVDGKFAYGYLKGENGVHRLVRISPFSAQKLRHTSFALVEVMPRITGGKEIEIKPEDVRIEMFRSSGPGGQNVNKRETAVRVIHIPTNISVACQSERSQAQNREKAMNLLRSKLVVLNLQKEGEEKQRLKGEKVKIEWGRQIRSYVLHPYQLVKDHRTEVETSKIDEVLDGGLDMFIEAELRLKS